MRLDELRDGDLGRGWEGEFGVNIFCSCCFGLPTAVGEQNEWYAGGFQVLDGLRGTGDCGGRTEEDAVYIEGEGEVWYPLVGGLRGEITSSYTLMGEDISKLVKSSRRRLTSHESRIEEAQPVLDRIAILTVSKCWTAVLVNQVMYSRLLIVTVPCRIILALHACTILVNRGKWSLLVLRFPSRGMASGNGCLQLHQISLQAVMLPTERLRYYGTFHSQVLWRTSLLAEHKSEFVHDISELE